MTDIARALTSLGVNEWVLRGEPTNEEEFNQMFRKVTGADANGSAIESADPKDWGTTWEKVSAEKKKLTDAEPMRLLRLERNRLLAESDWMANSDVTMPDEWKTYRQQLRDFPASPKINPQLKDDGTLNMTSVSWPTKPSQE